MYKIVARVAIVAAVLLVALLILAATGPDNFRVQRAASIKAHPDKIFALINDFHKWGLWSPYEKLDPAMKRSYSGPDSGKSAVYEWNGQEKAGAGRMEIMEASVPSKVRIKLDFSKPFKAHNTAEFTLETEGESTNVTWAMYGPSPYIFKLMHLFFNMDNLVGKDFEAGLANLKVVAEK